MRLVIVARVSAIVFMRGWAAGCHEVVAAGRQHIELTQTTSLSVEPPLNKLCAWSRSKQI
jgi:hypothetical protein